MRKKGGTITEYGGHKIRAVFLWKRKTQALAGGDDDHRKLVCSTCLAASERKNREKPLTRLENQAGFDHSRCAGRQMKKYRRGQNQGNDSVQQQPSVTKN